MDAGALPGEPPEGGCCPVSRAGRLCDEVAGAGMDGTAIGARRQTACAIGGKWLGTGGGTVGRKGGTVCGGYAIAWRKALPEQCPAQMRRGIFPRVMRKGVAGGAAFCLLVGRPVRSTGRCERFLKDGGV